MKGVILAGGKGTRLGESTRVTNKHLLPVYDKPMIFYPINTLKNAGIKKILIITGPEHMGDFLELLGSGKDFSLDFTYKVQDEALGIAHALSLAEDFACGEDIVIILGDNIIQDDISEHVQNFTAGAKIFLKEVPDPNRFGVAETKDNKIVAIEEKPQSPKSNLAVIGLYIYDNQVFDIIKTLKPSARGEYEITDVNNAYIQNSSMSFAILKGFWSDAGTKESLLKASQLVKETQKNL